MNAIIIVVRLDLVELMRLTDSYVFYAVLIHFGLNLRFSLEEIFKEPINSGVEAKTTLRRSQFEWKNEAKNHSDKWEEKRNERKIM